MVNWPTGLSWWQQLKSVKKPAITNSANAEDYDQSPIKAQYTYSNAICSNNILTIYPFRHVFIWRNFPTTVDLQNEFFLSILQIATNGKNPAMERSGWYDTWMFLAVQHETSIDRREYSTPHHLAALMDNLFDGFLPRAAWKP